MKHLLLAIFIAITGFCNSSPVNHSGANNKKAVTGNLPVNKLYGNKVNTAYANPQLTASADDPSTWRGVNLPMALNGKTKNVLSQADFQYAADAGANIIRLAVYADPDKGSGNVNVSFLGDDGNVLPSNSNPGITYLKQAIGMAAAANLKVIIDMHNSPGVLGGKIWEDEHYWDVLTQIWTLIAGEFKDNNTVAAFDLMNEPKILTYIKKQNLISRTDDEAKMYSGAWSPPQDWKNTPRDYNWNMGKLIGAIRHIDPNRCVIVEGFGVLGNPVNYDWMKPIEGFNNVVYSFHMYIPTGLTNLGTKGSIRKDKGEDVAPFNLADDEPKIDKAFAPVIAFQKKYHVPIFVGEFGITTKAIFGKDENGNSYNGACWLSTVIKKMNENKWGWTYWNFWTPIRKPKSKDDPRYIILSAAMHGRPIPEYCK